MGKIVTPKHYVKYQDQDGWHVVLWRGRANDARAEAWRRDMNESFYKGVNAHCRTSHGGIVHISRVAIIRSADGVLVAQAKMPMFEVVG